MKLPFPKTWFGICLVNEFLTKSCYQSFQLKPQLREAAGRLFIVLHPVIFSFPRSLCHMSHHCRLHSIARTVHHQKAQGYSHNPHCGFHRLIHYPITQPECRRQEGRSQAAQRSPKGPKPS